MPSFSMLGAIPLSEVRGGRERICEMREKEGISLERAKQVLGAEALSSYLCEMRFRAGRFEGASDRVCLDALLDLLINATDPSY